MKIPEGRPSPRTALVLSLAVYPGAGQALNRRWGKAACFGLAFTLAFLALIGTVALGLYEFYRSFTALREPVPLLQALGPAILPFVATVAIYGLAALDAWVEARAHAAAAEASTPPPPAAPAWQARPGAPPTHQEGPSWQAEEPTPPPPPS